MKGTVTRRRLLQILLGGMGALGFARFAAAAEKLPAGSPNEILATRLGSVIVHENSAVAIGREYLKIAPLEANSGYLVHLICSPEQQQVGSFLGADSRAVGEWLRNKQREDFELGRIVLVQGWMLSQTEARLCALVALT